MAGTVFKSKAQAVKAVESRGYVYEGEGQCGDGAFGTRIYFSKPGCEKNQFGCPMDTAQVDKVRGLGWLASVNFKEI